jgi:hypothetical protein
VEERPAREKAAEEKTAPAKRAATTPEPAAAPAPLQDGTLEIRAVPYASYYINGELRAKDRGFARIALPPGTYAVRIEHPTLGAHEFPPVTIVSGATSSLDHVFATATAGTLRIASGGIYAEVYLDDQPTGKTTPCKIEGVPAGNHKVSIVREGFVVEGGPQVVAVRAGAEATVTFALTPR